MKPLTLAQRHDIHRAIADALASVDALWSREAFGAIIARNPGERAPAMLRELIVDALAGELELQLSPESFEALLDARRMSS